METFTPSLIRAGVKRRFKPTYKEWKRSIPLSFSVLFPCFKPTYKEWKRSHRGNSFRVGPHVLSLPTRNGNTSAQGSWEFFPALVLSLPTRNGNRFGIGGQTRLGVVLSLPTRNGNNNSRICHKIHIHPVLSLPTRNGNVWVKSGEGCLLPGFKPTYKEWKRVSPTESCPGNKF